MAWKEKIVTAAIFVSSLFGGGAAKAAKVSNSEMSSKEDIEVIVDAENNDERKNSNIYTGWGNDDKKGSNIYTGSGNSQTGNRNNRGQSNIYTGSGSSNRGGTSNIYTGGGYSSNPVKNRINNTKQAIKNVVRRNVRKFEQAGANWVYKLDREYLRARDEARRDAYQKQRSDKKFAQDFSVVLSNALIFKYQVDNGRNLKDYIPHNTREAIAEHANLESKKVYKMLRNNTNEDIIMEYMGQALEGVGYTQNGNIYEYRGQQVSIGVNLVEQMGIKKKGYTIGGTNAYSYGNSNGSYGSNIYTGNGSGTRTSNIYTGR